MPQASLWREAFLLFGRHWRAWAKEALWFFVFWLVILTASNLFADAHKEEIADISKNHKSLPPGWILGFCAYGLSFLVVALVQTYLFKAFFLEREPLFVPVRASMNGFFRYVGVIFKVFFLFVGFGIAGALVIAAAVALKSVLPEFVAKILMVIAACGTFGGLYYIVFKIYPAFTLVIAGVDSPIKVGWKLTDGNWWRIWLNFVALFFLLMLPLLIGTIILKLATHNLGTAGTVVLSLWNAVTQVAMGGLVAAFGCAVCRVLYLEKHTADSSFTLTNKP